MLKVLLADCIGTLGLNLFDGRGSVPSPRVETRICKRVTCVAPAALVFLLGIMTAAPVFAQVSYYAGIRGIVHDPTGAVVPNVKVTLTDEPRNVARTTTTNNSGEYTFTEVIPSTYSVAAEVAGFKKLERHGVIIGTQDRITLDLALEVGAVTQSVEVTAAAPLIETATASNSQALNEQKLADLPNIGRNPYFMATITQNVVHYGNPVMNRMQDQTSTANTSTGGSIGYGTNYIIDGVPTSDWAGRSIIIPSIEAVQEVKVMVTTFDAEQGRNGGGVMNTVLKSGSNDIHGDLYGAFRRNSMDANMFFNNAANIPLTPIPNDNWAGNIGGPLVIPHLYNGRNRTFWFAAYEGYNNGAANAGTFYVPTALEKTGDFSKTVSSSGAPIIIYDPSTTVLNPNGTYTRTSFLAETGANKIPVLNTVGKNIAGYFPSAMTTPAYYGEPDYTGSTTSMSLARQYVGKLDEQFTDRWRSSISYMHCLTEEPGPIYFGGPAANQSWALFRKEDLTAINNLITLSPTTVLAVRYGFNRFPNLFNTSGERLGFDPATLGFPASYVDAMQGRQFPVINGTTMAGLGTSSSSLYNLFSYNASAMISKSRGHHSLKAGFDFRRLVVTGYGYADESGNYTFNGIFTQSSPVSPLPNTGADLADLLLGYPASGDTTVSARLTDYVNYYAGYLQDDVRVNSRLTLNLGLRWEREYGFREAQNRLYVGFNETAINPEAAYVPASVIVPRGVPEWAGQGENPLGVGDPQMNKLGPRIGFAYQIDSKTVLRGGVGIIWGPVVENLLGTFSPAGFSATTPYIATLNGYATSAGSLSNPSPSGLLQPIGLAAGSLTGIGQSLSIRDPSAKAPMITQYSADLERELPGGIAVSLGYLGTHGTHLPMDVNQNALDPNYFSMGASALTGPVTNPFYGTPGGVGIIGTSTVPAYQLLLPYVTYGSVTFSATDLNSSSYNSLVAKAQKRMGHGLTFLSTLTWAKSVDSWSNGNSMMQNAGGVQNPFNLQAERGLSQFNVPLFLGLAFSYELPAGKGKPFLSNNRAADYVLGGWELNGIAHYRSGFPLAMVQATDYNAPFGYAVQRPNATGVAPATSGSLESRLSDYINPAAFSVAPEFTFGNASRYIPMRGPGWATWDFSLFKTVTIKERFKAQFRAEALNAFNTPLFSGPNTTVASGLLGEITGQMNLGRQMQLCIRLMW